MNTNVHPPTHMRLGPMEHGVFMAFGHPKNEIGNPYVGYIWL
jgi:hypothetical protein